MNGLHMLLFHTSSVHSLAIIFSREIYLLCTIFIKF